MPSLADEERDPLDELADDFLDRWRRGQRPSVEEFVARIPDRAGEIRELLSALVFVEDLKAPVDQTVERLGKSSLAGAGLELERLGDFQILREIGRGGMGVVYEAEQLSLGRRVALKVLAPRVSRTSQQARRFLREARSAAQLHHTNIVPVFGVGDQDGLHFYAMQYIQGPALDKVLEEVKRLKRSTLPVDHLDGTPTLVFEADPLGASIVRSLVQGEFASGPATQETATFAASSTWGGTSSLARDSESDRRYAKSVAKVGLQVAEALDYAHQQGTLHRDIKPSNLLLDAHGTVWVTDFGLAKMAEDDDLTRTGDVVGTLRYMAPERFRGQCDARSDVHALGLTLYELLALKPAFDSNHRDSLVYLVMHVAPPPLRLHSRFIPKDLETIVHKAIEKEPGDRYPTAGALAEDLRLFLEDRPIQARPLSSTERLSRWARKNPGLAALGAALVLMLTSIIAVIAVANHRLFLEHQQTVANLNQVVKLEAEAVSKLVESYLVQARASRRSGVAGRRFNALWALGEAARLDANASRLLELRNETIACLALTDLRPIRSWADRDDGSALGSDVDLDADRVAYGRTSGEIVLKTLSNDREILRLPGAGLRPAFLRFSRDQKFLAARLENASRSELVVWDLNRRQPVLKVPEGFHSEALDFHPDGRSIASGRRDGSIVIHDLETGQELRRLTPGTVPQTIRFDPLGNRIAVVSPNSEDVVQIREMTTGSVVARWPLPEAAFSVAWHPKARWLAVGCESGKIALLDAESPSAPPRALEGHDGKVISLDFQPEGPLLASASEDGTLRLWEARTGQERVWAPLPIARPIHFSRDGRRLGPGHDGTSSWIWEVAGGRECRTLVDESGSGSKYWSVDFLRPDGLLLTTGSQGFRLAELGDSGASATVSLPGTAGVVGSPDGSFLISSGTTGLLKWPITRPSESQILVGPPDWLPGHDPAPGTRLHLSRDGSTLAVVVDGEVGRVEVSSLSHPATPRDAEGHANLERVELSPEGRWMATGTLNGTGIKIWETRTGKILRELPVEGSASATFSPDGTQLVTGSGTEYTIWSTATWKPVSRVARSQAIGVAGEATFSGDGKILALAKTRGLVHLIDPQSGQELAALESPRLQHITAMGFSPDDQFLVLSFHAGYSQVWDLQAIQTTLATMNLGWRPPVPLVPIPPSGNVPRSIAIRPAPWMELMERGESLARSGRGNEAGERFDKALAAGARHVDAWTRRALFCRVRGEESAYQECCRHLQSAFDPRRLALKTANNIAWSCALGSGAIKDYAVSIQMAELAAASQPTTSRLNTLGAILYRAGRFEDADRQLQRSVAAHGAGGTPYDALFLAMTHMRLGRKAEAERWLKRAEEPTPIAMRKPDVAGDSSWIPRYELDLLRREARDLVHPPGP